MATTPLQRKLIVALCMVALAAFLLGWAIHDVMARLGWVDCN
jgi:hypothetical protein